MSIDGSTWRLSAGKIIREKKAEALSGINIFLLRAYYINIADYPGVKNFPVLNENSLL